MLSIQGSVVFWSCRNWLLNNSITEKQYYYEEIIYVFGYYNMTFTVIAQPPTTDELSELVRTAGGSLLPRKA